jgi:hypothetical protein
LRSAVRGGAAEVQSDFACQSTALIEDLLIIQQMVKQKVYKEECQDMSHCFCLQHAR